MAAAESDAEASKSSEAWEPISAEPSHSPASCEGDHDDRFGGAEQYSEWKLLEEPAAGGGGEDGAPWHSLPPPGKGRRALLFAAKKNGGATVGLKVLLNSSSGGDRSLIRELGREWAALNVRDPVMDMKLSGFADCRAMTPDVWAFGRALHVASCPEPGMEPYGDSWVSYQEPPAGYLDALSVAVLRQLLEKEPRERLPVDVAGLDKYRREGEARKRIAAHMVLSLTVAEESRCDQLMEFLKDPDAEVRKAGTAALPRLCPAATPACVAGWLRHATDFFSSQGRRAAGGVLFHMLQAQHERGAGFSSATMTEEQWKEEFERLGPVMSKLLRHHWKSAACIAVLDLVVSIFLHRAPSLQCQLSDPDWRTKIIGTPRELFAWRCLALAVVPVAAAVAVARHC